MFRCPTCDIPLCGMTYEGVKIHRCPDCGGCLVEDARLGAIEKRCSRTWSSEDEDRLCASVARNDRRDAVRCPRCLMPMTKVAAGQAGNTFHVDHCDPCRCVWFDGGEMELLQIHHKKERDGRTEADWDRVERQASAELALREGAREIADHAQGLRRRPLRPLHFGPHASLPEAINLIADFLMQDGWRHL